MYREGVVGSVAVKMDLPAIEVISSKELSEPDIGNQSDVSLSVAADGALGKWSIYIWCTVCLCCSSASEHPLHVVQAKSDVHGSPPSVVKLDDAALVGYDASIVE